MNDAVASGRTQPPYDVFLCYKWDDQAAAETLYAALRSQALNVFLDRLDGEEWRPLAGSVRQALDGSRTLLALITENFPRSPHCREELHVALCAAYQLDGHDTSRVMALIQGRVSPDDVRPKQLTTNRLPYSSQPQAEVLDSIVRNVNAHDGLIGDAPDPPLPDWYPREPPGGVSFHGRYSELWDIHDGLRARARTSVLGKPVVAVTGLGGEGKTALCLQYARLFARDHPGGVFVLDFGGSTGGGSQDDLTVAARFDEHLRGVARHLGVAGSREVSAALARLERPYLWIADDVPSTLSEEMLTRILAPTLKGRTLITTRGAVLHDVSGIVALGPGTPLGKRHAVDVLTAHRPKRPGEKADVEAVVALLGEHPLSLRLAAGLTRNARFESYRALLDDLSTPGPDLLENSALQVGLPNGGYPLSRVMLRSFEWLDNAGRQVLSAASVLGPAVIPPELLAGIVRRSGARHGTNLADGIAECIRHGLLAEAGSGCTMHAVVARGARLLIRPQQYRACLRNAALAELTAVLDRTRDTSGHGEALPYLPHVRTVAGLSANQDGWSVGLDELHLSNETGRVLIESGRSGEALEFAEAMYEACLLAEVDWYTRNVVLSTLAIAHEERGDYSVALRMKDEVFRTMEQRLGGGEEATLKALSNVAVAHLRLKQYEEAHDLLRRVYTARRGHRRLGPTAPDTLEALNNLAIARGHLDGPTSRCGRGRRVAHRYWLAAWDSWELLAGPGERRHLDALNGLALSYRALKMPRQAMELMTDLYERRRDLLGPEHPETLDAMENKIILRQELHGGSDE